MSDQPMTRAGISGAIFLGSAIALGVLSILLVAFLEARNRGPEEANPSYPKLDLLSNKTVNVLVRKRPFQFVMRLPLVLLFLFIIFAGFFGTQSAGSKHLPGSRD